MKIINLNSNLAFILAIAVGLIMNAGVIFSQETSEFIHGKVVSSSGEPLIGAGILIKGTGTGVTTDLDGNYSIKAPEKGKSFTLVFQYIGMVSKEIPVSQPRLLNVTLVEDNKLSEAVIVGAYGTKQSREDMIGSAFQVNASQLKDKPKTRVDNLLEGLVPGMSIDPNTDAAGSTRARNNVRVRGEASLSASNEPLWVVDGVPFYTGDRTNQIPGMSYSVSPLSMLDPNDIESITVLKDADQVTIYGANGANGVILVTTKSGAKNMPLRVSATVNYGVATPDRSTMFKVMNASQYMEVAKEAWINSGKPMSTFPFQDNEWNSYSTTSTDWADKYIGIGQNVYANVSLRGGTKRITSQVSASYYREENIVISDKMDRFTFKARNVFDLTRWMKLDTSLSASYNDNDLFPISREYFDTLPIYEPYMQDGTYRLYNMVFEEGSFKKKRFNDNKIPQRRESINNQKSLKTTGNFALSIDIMKGLQFNAQYSLDYMHSHEDMYSSRLTIQGTDYSGQPVGSTRRADASYLTWTNVERLNFDRTFGKHKVGAYIGLELHQKKIKTLSGTASGFMNDNIQEITYADETTIKANSNTDISRSMSFFGRATYSYDSRYYVSANYRRDGNSGFGIYSRWANFWSVGLSWNIHNEKFFKSNLVKMLKLKASYGTNGNSRVDSSQAVGAYTYGSTYSYMGQMGAVVSTMPNPGLSWETTRMFNIGARIELGDRFSAEVEYYNNYTSDLLSKIYVSRTLSSDRIYANVGEMRNFGAELTINSTNVRTRNFSWDMGLNVSHNSNRIEKLYNGMTTSFGTTLWREGYDSNTYYLVEWAGVDPSDGMPMWYDLDGNITKSYSTSNRKPGKSATPILFGGWTNTFTYKNWSLSFQINYTIGGYSLATYASNYFEDGYSIATNNQAVEVYLHRWKTPGQVAAFPKVSDVSTQSGMSSTRFLYNKTNFKLTNVVLTYNIPEKVLEKVKMKGASVSFVCDNAYLLTPDQKRGLNSYKTMMSGYPMTRTFTLSLNASF